MYPLSRLWGCPFSQAFTKSAELLESFAAPLSLCSFQVRSGSLMEPEPRGWFSFSSPPCTPNTCPQCTLTPREFHISKSGTSWNVPPKGHQRDNCPGGFGLKAFESLQIELSCACLGAGSRGSAEPAYEGVGGNPQTWITHGETQALVLYPG